MAKQTCAPQITYIYIYINIQTHLYIYEDVTTTSPHMQIHHQHMHTIISRISHHQMHTHTYPHHSTPTNAHTHTCKWAPKHNDRQHQELCMHWLGDFVTVDKLTKHHSLHWTHLVSGGLVQDKQKSHWVANQSQRIICLLRSRFFLASATLQD